VPLLDTPWRVGGKENKISLSPSLRRRETNWVKALIYGVGKWGKGVMDIHGTGRRCYEGGGPSQVKDKGGKR